MVLTKPINTNDSDMFLYNIETNELTKISENQAGHSPADFSKDGKPFYYLTDDGAEFQYLMRYDLEDGSREKIMEENWDINYAYFSHNGKYRVAGINEDGKTVVKITDIASGKKVAFPEFDNGDITSVNIAETRV